MIALKRKLGQRLSWKRWQNLTLERQGMCGKDPQKPQIRRVDQMKGNLIARDKRRPKKIIGKTIKEDIEFNDLNINIIHDKT